MGDDSQVSSTDSFTDSSSIHKKTQYHRVTTTIKLDDVEYSSSSQMGVLTMSNNTFIKAQIYKYLSLNSRTFGLCRNEDIV